MPVTEGVYDFRTDQRTDVFTVVTAVGADNTTVQLFAAVYDDDTSTIELSSDDTDDSPLYNSYDTGTRALAVTGLADNTTRSMDVLYDVDALGVSDAISNFLDVLAWIWILIWVAFPIAGLAAIWTGRAY